MNRNIRHVPRTLAEMRPEAANHLGGKTDLRDEHESGLPRGEAVAYRLDVDLGLPASRHPVEEERPPAPASTAPMILSTILRWTSFKTMERTCAFSLAIIGGPGSTRIVEYAYEYARANGRRKVTTVHKANILKCTGGLFLDVSREVGKKYPEIATDDRIIDNMAMQMVMNPHQFDVIVTTNLFGDILSDLASGLVRRT